jgi:hypothetical protein
MSPVCDFLGGLLPLWLAHSLRMITLLFVVTFSCTSSIMCTLPLSRPVHGPACCAYTPFLPVVGIVLMFGCIRPVLPRTLPLAAMFWRLCFSCSNPGPTPVHLLARFRDTSLLFVGTLVMAVPSKPC